MVSARKAFVCSLLLLAVAFSPAVSIHAQNQAKQDKQQRAEEKERHKREKAQQDEIKKSPYADWVNQDAAYILTEEERTAFFRLSTNEERERFIEIVWGMRDPTPDTQENEFKDEHYRRIAYANERFASGVPGWKTDRGRIYIIWGPPDEIESHAGGPYLRPREEGGGQTSVHPFEKWRYRHMEGIRNDVILEFVDVTGSGEFRLTMDPSEKDALTFVPGAGSTECEALGQCSRLDRYTRPDGTHLGRPLGGDTLRSVFDRMEDYARVQRAPALRFHDLQAHVDSRLVRNLMDFSYRTDFIRVTGDTVLVPITVQIPNREMTFLNKEGVHVATVNLFARITTMTGIRVHVFEDTISRDIPESLLAQAVKGNSIYQKAVPLRPGLYKLDIVMKDVNSGNVGVVQERLPVPRFNEENLSASSLILADLIEPVAAGNLNQPFVLGALKVRPRVDKAFATDDRFGVFLQVYNLTINPETRAPSASATFTIRHEGTIVSSVIEPSLPSKSSGTQLTIEKQLPLTGLAPGGYTLQVLVTDNRTGQSVTQSTTFTVKPSEKLASR